MLVKTSTVFYLFTNVTDLDPNSTYSNVCQECVTNTALK